MNSVRILHGDCRAVLQREPAGSVHMVVTSPPYYGLRDYKLSATIWGGDPACEHVWTDVADGYVGHRGNRGQVPQTKWPGQQEYSQNLGGQVSGFCACGGWLGTLGLEPTPDLYVAHLVDVFREVWRALRDDGTLWINLGDSYASAWPAPSTRRNIIGNPMAGGKRGPQRQSKLSGTLKEKDLIGIPWLTALSLRDDGWYLRRDIIWAKPNPMPESVEDRPTTSHEYIFLLTKHERYFYDAEAIAEPQVEQERLRRIREHEQGLASVYALNRDTIAGQAGQAMQSATGTARSVVKRQELALKGTRNRRSVWTISTKPFAEAHFATFPLDLVEVPILAGTSARGCCRFCGAPWERVMWDGGLAGEAIIQSGARPAADHRGVSSSSALRPNGRTFRASGTVGWRPTCRCRGQRGRTVPAVVLDPFGGAGTAALMAVKLNRDAVSIEANAEYVEMQERRIEQEVGSLLVQIRREPVDTP